MMPIQSQSEEYKMGKLERLYGRRLDKDVVVASVGQRKNKKKNKFEISIKPDRERLSTFVDERAGGIVKRNHLLGK